MSYDNKMCDSDLISRFFDRELEEDEYEQIENHIKSCSTCRNNLAEYENISGKIKSVIIKNFEMDSGKLEDYKLKLRRLTYTGGKLDTDTIEYFQEKLGLTIQSCYGSTEVGVILADYDFDDWNVKPGSLGMPLPGKKVAVIDEEGNISTPIMGVDLPVEDHPGLDSDIGKEVKKLKKKLLGNNNQLDEKNEGE